MSRLAFIVLFIASLVAPLLALPTPALAANCQFVLGFQTLDSLITQAVGTCLENQHYASNGDAQQQTTGGLLVWRKADNWTAFTDGYHTWINGPKGLQERLNTQRFSWEADSAGFPLADAAPAPAPSPAPLGYFAFHELVLGILNASKTPYSDLRDLTVEANDNPDVFFDPTWRAEVTANALALQKSGTALENLPPVIPELTKLRGLYVTMGRDQVGFATSYIKLVQTGNPSYLTAAIGYLQRLQTDIQQIELEEDSLST